MSTPVSVVPSCPSARGRAHRIAVDLGLPEAGAVPSSPDAIALMVDDVAAWLQLGGRDAPGPVAVDFASAAMRHRRQAGHNEAIGRAVGVKGAVRPDVVDATAGLGRDAFVLADLGCRVTLCERSQVLAWLLEDAIDRGRISRHDSVRDACARMTLLAGDCRERDFPAGRVIYLDPMFSERNTRAAVKKDLALLQALHQDSAADGDLLEWALGCSPARVVVKRPAKAPPLEGRAPGFSIPGKTVRFDVIVP